MAARRLGVPPHHAAGCLRRRIAGRHVHERTVRVRVDVALACRRRAALPGGCDGRRGVCHAPRRGSSSDPVVARVGNGSFHCVARGFSSAGSQRSAVAARHGFRCSGSPYLGKHPGGLLAHLPSRARSAASYGNLADARAVAGFAGQRAERRDRGRISRQPSGRRCPSAVRRPGIPSNRAALALRRPGAQGGYRSAGRRPRTFDRAGVSATGHRARSVLFLSALPRHLCDWRANVRRLRGNYALGLENRRIFSRIGSSQ